MDETRPVVVDKPNPWWRRYMQEDPGVVLTVGYLFLTIIGAFYNWRLCSRFGINILELADVTDFLMFAVRDAMVVFLAAFEILLFAGVYGVIARSASTPIEKRKGLARILSRHVKEEKDLRSLAILMTLSAVFFSFYVLNSYSANVASGIKAGQGRPCEYVVPNDGKGAPQPGQFVTATSRFVVVFRLEDKTTQVIPVESLERLVFKR